MNEPYYHGIKGQRWGVKRYLNKDGTLTPTEKKDMLVSTVFQKEQHCIGQIQIRQIF